MGETVIECLFLPRQVERVYHFPSRAAAERFLAAIRDRAHRVLLDRVTDEACYLDCVIDDLVLSCVLHSGGRCGLA